MTREQWLENKHKELDKLVWEIETTKPHDTLLKDLKKRKLLLKDEIRAMRMRKNA